MEKPKVAKELTEELTLDVEELEERIAPGIVANFAAPAHAGPAAGPHIPQVAIDNWFGGAAVDC